MTNRTGKKKFFFSAFLALMIILPLGTIKVLADSVTTTVTVGNSAPSFSVAPAESVASDGTTPTNVGVALSFTATATDTNSENFYLAICKTNSVTPVNGGAPTCGGGSWCISTTTASGVQASCSYTPVGGDAESNAWYGFACDGNSGSAQCSSSNQGSGSTGSPFKVNHAPTFNAISNDGPKNPGASLTFSTDSSTLDGDTDTANDTVKLIVCKTTGLTADDCDGGSGDRWCASSLVANNPSCSVTLDNPLTDGSYNAYAYLVDNHNFGATGGNQGSNSSFTVSNVAPVVSSVTLNGGSDISLTESTTTSVAITAVVTDNNSCQDISAVETSLYRTGVGYSACDANAEDDNNDCYAQVTCTVAGSGNTCTGATDASATYECTVSVQYHADSTVSGTQYPSETWKNTVKGSDEAASGTTEVTTGVELLSLVAYDVTSSIAYGNLSVGQSNDPLDKVVTVTATGNVGLDVENSGTDMASGGNTIAINHQKYALAASTAYASGTSLSTSATEVELNVAKTTVTGSPEDKDQYFGLSVPSGTVAGSYTGTNTIVAVAGETAGW